MRGKNPIDGAESREIYERLDLTEAFERFPVDCVMALQRAHGLKQALRTCLLEFDPQSKISGGEQ